MLSHELLNKDPDVLPDEAPLIILESKSVMCMDKNGKDAKHRRQIARRIHFVRNGKSTICTGLTGVREVCNWHKLIPIMLVSMI